MQTHTCPGDSLFETTNRVLWYRCTNISEEPSASIFMVLRRINPRAHTSQNTSTVTVTTATTPHNCTIRRSFLQSTSCHEDYSSPLATRTFIKYVADEDKNQTIFTTPPTPPFTSVLYFLTNVSKSILVGGNYISDDPSAILQYLNDILAVSDYSPHCVPCTCLAYKNRRPHYVFHLPVYTHVRAHSLERNNVNGSFSYDTY